MYPFYRASIDSGETTDTEVLELLEMLRIKMTEIEYVASFSWSGLGSGNLYQNMILGGIDENGQGADNELSMLIVQSAINCQTTQPTPGYTNPYLCPEVLIDLTNGTRKSHSRSVTIF